MITNINTNKKAEIDIAVLSSYEDIMPDRIIDIDHLTDELGNELEEELHKTGDYRELTKIQSEDIANISPVHANNFISKS